MNNKLPKKVCLSDMKDFEMSEELADILNEEITDYLSSKYGFEITAYGWELIATDIIWGEHK